MEAQAQDRIHRLGQHKAHPCFCHCPNPALIARPRRNPAVEAQAQDRIHRLGQHKPIHVTRFVIGGTIEERILKLQARPYPTLHPATRAGQRGVLRCLLSRRLAILPAQARDAGAQCWSRAAPTARPPRVSAVRWARRSGALHVGCAPGG